MTVWRRHCNRYAFSAFRSFEQPQGRIYRSLVKAIAWAHELRHRLERSGEIGLQDLAREEGCSRPYVSSMIRLAYLAPAITQAILDGTQPPRLTLAALMRRDIPVDWTEQRRAFGFL
jgi:site-specific DNA recombinase